MEFNEKLQLLRKQKGLTQEELAQAVYVSRAAVSKWESGRGYPNIDSLKAIAKFFSVTVDELLSCDEALAIAEEDCKQMKGRFCDLIFGMLDCSAAALFVLPLFGQKTQDAVRAVSLLQLSTAEAAVWVFWIAAVIAMVAAGIITLALQNCTISAWQSNKHRISLALNVMGLLLFILSRQPYAAVFLFILLAIKAFVRSKRS